MKTYILDLDKPRELRFGFKAMRTIRAKFGERSLESIMQIKWDEIPILAWGGLKWEDKQLTLNQVEDLLDDAIPKKYTIIKASEIVLEAFADHMGLETKKDKAGDQLKAELMKLKDPKERKKIAAELTALAGNPEELQKMVEAVVKKSKEATRTIPSTKKQKK